MWIKHSERGLEIGLWIIAAATAAILINDHFGFW